MKTRLLLLGTGTPTPLTHRGGSSYLLETGGKRIVVDCGPASVRRLLDAGIPLPSIDTLLLTHLHYDHCVDYPYLVLTRWDQGIGKIPELPVIGPAPLAQMTEKLFADDGAFGPDLIARCEHPGSQFVYEARGGVLPRKRPYPEVTEVEHGSEIQGEGWKLQVAEVVHMQPQLRCLAYRIDTEAGESIVFGGDTAPVKRLTELSRGADVLLHMCHFVNGEETDERITGCCSGHLDAARTAKEAGVKTLVLIHLTEQLEIPGLTERVLSEVGDVFDGQVILGRDLLEVPLGTIEVEKVR